MPNEPERNIEKLLKACAQKRRDEAGAPLELHPASRRMLHAEVVCRTAKAPRGNNVFVRMLTELRPRLALGAAILAVMVVATWGLLPSLDKTRGKVQMAQRDAPSPAKLARRAGKDVASAPTEMSATGPVTETPALAFDSALKEDSSAAVTMQVRMAAHDFEMGRRAETAESQVRDKAITTGGFENANVAKDGAKGAFVAGEPMPPPRADATAAFRTGSYGLTKSPAPPTSEPLPVTTAGAAALVQQALRQETRERSLIEGDSLKKTDVALARPAAAAPKTDVKQKVLDTDTGQTPSLSVTQRFAQVDSRLRTVLAAKAVNSLATKEILTSFQIAQAGDRIQVIDSDGSTYVGFLRPAPQPSAQPAPAVPPKSRVVLVGGVQSVKEAERRPAIVADKPAAPQNPAYCFQVVGTNSTFQQRVVFTGNFLLDTNALSAMRSNADSNQRSVFQFQQNGPTPPELQNSRITGQAIIGDGRTLQINAAPASP